jgi:hypothetical protein
MVLVVETNDTAWASTTEWGKYLTDISTLENIAAWTNTTTMTNNIVAWDWLSNTQKIVTAIWTSETLKAAQKCNTKWTGRRLPATEELNQLYCYNNNDATNDWTYYWAWANHADCVNKWYIADNKMTLSNFSATYYWSSTEISTNDSRYQGFNNGLRYYNYHKNYALAVRCVSRF